jgi:CRP-like cAMP-binding protein
MQTQTNKCAKLTLLCSTKLIVVRVDVLRQGSSFGELAMIDRSATRSASIVVSKKCSGVELLTLERSVYQELAQASRLDQKGKSTTFSLLLARCHIIPACIYPPLSLLSGTEQADFLRQLCLFEDWPKDHLERFSSHLRRLKFKVGDYIFRQMHDSNGIYFIKSGEAVEIMPIAIDEVTGRAKNIVFSSSSSSNHANSTAKESPTLPSEPSDCPTIIPPQGREMSNEEVLDAQKRRRRRQNKTYQTREENVRRLDVELTLLSVHDVCGEYPVSHNFHKKHHVDLRAVTDLVVLHADKKVFRSFIGSGITTYGAATHKVLRELSDARENWRTERVRWSLKYPTLKVPITRELMKMCPSLCPLCGIKGHMSGDYLCPRTDVAAFIPMNSSERNTRKRNTTKNRRARGEHGPSPRQTGEAYCKALLQETSLHHIIQKATIADMKREIRTPPPRDPGGGDGFSNNSSALHHVKRLQVHSTASNSSSNTNTSRGGRKNSNNNAAGALQVAVAEKAPSASIRYTGQNVYRQKNLAVKTIMKNSASPVLPTPTSTNGGTPKSASAGRDDCGSKPSMPVESEMAEKKIHKTNSHSFPATTHMTGMAQLSKAAVRFKHGQKAAHRRSKHVPPKPVDYTYDYIGSVGSGNEPYSATLSPKLKEAFTVDTFSAGTDPETDDLKVECNNAVNTDDVQEKIAQIPPGTRAKLLCEYRCTSPKHTLLHKRWKAMLKNTGRKMGEELTVKRPDLERPASTPLSPRPPRSSSESYSLAAPGEKNATPRSKTAMGLVSTPISKPTTPKQVQLYSILLIMV